MTSSQQETYGKTMTAAEVAEMQWRELKSELQATIRMCNDFDLDDIKAKALEIKANIGTTGEEYWVQQNKLNALLKEANKAIA